MLTKTVADVNTQFLKMKINYILLVLFFFNLKVMNAQLSPKGKSYTAVINSTCKLMEGGGCLINTYCVLKFNKATVQVSYFVEAECTPHSREKNYNQNPSNETKTYDWVASQDTLQIIGFNDYGTFKFFDDKLIAKKKMNENFAALEFVRKK